MRSLPCSVRQREYMAAAHEQIAADRDSVGHGDNNVRFDAGISTPARVIHTGM